jgi:hypothetical protein
VPLSWLVTEHDKGVIVSLDGENEWFEMNLQVHGT